MTFTVTFSITNALHFISSNNHDDDDDDKEDGDVDDDDGGGAIFIRIFGLVECYGIFNVFRAAQVSPDAWCHGVLIAYIIHRKMYCIIHKIGLD